MIILHENLQKEAERVASTFEEVYKIKSELLNESLEGIFKPIPEFEGFSESADKIWYVLKSILNKAVLVITDRDIYADNKSKEDDWVFGYCVGNLSLASLSRLKRQDSQPSRKIEIPMESYLKRIDLLSLHEIGHDVVKAKHFELAKWINAKTGKELALGHHCTDNKCAMYEIVDVNSPPKEQGYMLLGNQRVYDAGIENILERIYPNWFCNRCSESIVIDEKYN